MFNEYNRFPMGTLTVFLLALASLFFACSENYTAGTSEESEGIVAIKDREIAGISQKGPFLVGSSVAIQELDGHTLMQTGKSFRASIKNDQGDFVVKSVNLVSQYALLEVNGYYRNEVSGEKSKGMIALNALTDLKDRSHVNVNLMTHLTTDRIFALVQKEGKSFAEAKKQAEREVLNSFGVLDDLGDGEDFDLFTGDGGALLLAMSVLMQGDGSEADLSERVSHVATAIVNNGIWKGDEKTEIADWAFQIDAVIKKSKKGGSMLQLIRENVESWQVVDSVPPFEKYVNKFWAHEYGLGVCDEKNLYEVKSNTNELSQYQGSEFACNPDGRWSLVRMREIQSSLFEEIQDKADGEHYKVMKIGNKQWMAENLRRKSNAFNKWNNISYSTCYDEKQSNCDSYGLMYEWNAAAQLCPEGYKLPSISDVKALLQFYGGEGTESAQKLRAADGFGVVYGGLYHEKLKESPDGLDDMYYTGVFEYLGLHEMANYWTESPAFLLRIDSLGARLDSVDRRLLGSPVRASVRCVKAEHTEAEKGIVKERVCDPDDRDYCSDYPFDYTVINGKKWMAKNRTNELRLVETNYEMSYGDERWCPDEDIYNARCNMISRWERLYSWEDAIKLCPEGWRLPTRSEWVALMGDSPYVNSQGENGIYTMYFTDNFSLHDISHWSDEYYVSYANSYGLSIKPVGYYEKGFEKVKFGAAFWASSDSSSTDAYAFMLVDAYAGTYIMKVADKQNYYSVRCIEK